VKYRQVSDESVEAIIPAFSDTDSLGLLRRVLM
jgi:hypothetical protein